MWELGIFLNDRPLGIEFRFICKRALLYPDSASSLGVVPFEARSHHFGESRMSLVYMEDLPNGSKGIMAATTACLRMLARSKSSTHLNLAYHDNVEDCTNVDWRTRSRIRGCRHSSRHKSHDSVTCDCDSVSCRSVRGWQYFRCVCVESAIVDIHSEVDDACERQILGVGSNGGVGEEEGTRHKRANNHSVSKCMFRQHSPAVHVSEEWYGETHLRPSRVVHIQPARMGPKTETKLLIK